jgi:hypothetical protein
MNDVEQDLRERVRSFKNSVDPPPDLWDEVERRATKRPRSATVAVVAAVSIVILGLAVATIVIRRDHGHKVVASNGTADEPCGRPLPKPSEPASPDTAGPTLGGPAPSALTGGPAQSSFSLDDGGLVVKPPHAGDDPTISRSDAECVALTSRSAVSYTLLDPHMLGTESVAIGYGRVTIGSEVRPTQMDLRPSPDAPPTVPPSPPLYQDRLAWLVVVPDQRASSCPAFNPPSSTPAAPPVGVRSDAKVDEYKVLLLDARTGGSAVVYTAGAAGGCGSPVRNPPTVDVPLQRVSVPWKLGTRDRHDYTATISAEVLPCDQYDRDINVDAYEPVAAVVVERPVEPHCGSAKSVVLTLHAAADALPATIGHAPLGPYIEPVHDAPPPPSATESVLILPADNGKTFTVKVGSVLQLPTMDYAHPHPIHSSDPDVVGDVAPAEDTSNISSFRTWRAGEADLTLADGWKVHIVVQ